MNLGLIMLNLPVQFLKLAGPDFGLTFPVLLVLPVLVVLGLRLISD